MILTSTARQVSPLGTPAPDDTTIQVPPVLIPTAQFSEPIFVTNLGQNPTFTTSGMVDISSAVSGVTPSTNIPLCKIGPGMWELNFFYLVAMSFPVPDATFNNVSNENVLYFDNCMVLAVDIGVGPGMGFKSITLRMNLGRNNADAQQAWGVSFQRPACIVAEFVTVRGSCIATKLA